MNRGATVLLGGFLLLALLFAYLIARTITGLHGRVAEQAFTDPLTGLWNRRRLQQLLEREVERADRFGHELALLILDVDDFKMINDRYGHVQGDRVLVRIADIVRHTTRAVDVGARYGGDELALVLVETGTKGASELAERLRSLVRAARIPMRQGGTMSVTVSVGAAAVPDAARDGLTLLEAADQALLRAKRAGKDQALTAPRSA